MSRSIAVARPAAGFRILRLPVRRPAAPVHDTFCLRRRVSAPDTFLFMPFPPPCRFPRPERGRAGRKRKDPPPAASRLSCSGVFTSVLHARHRYNAAPALSVLIRAFPPLRLVSPHLPCVPPLSPAAAVSPRLPLLLSVPYAPLPPRRRRAVASPEKNKSRRV